MYLCEEIANTSDSERLPLVTEFAGKWWADVSVCYDGYTYEMNLLNAGESELLNSSETTKVVDIIAEETDGKIKISLSQNPKGGTDFFYVERILPNENGYVKATVYFTHYCLFMYAYFNIVLLGIFSYAHKANQTDFKRSETDAGIDIGCTL